MRTVIVHRIEMGPLPKTFGTFKFTPAIMVPWLMQNSPDSVVEYLVEQFEQGYVPPFPWSDEECAA